MSTQGIDLPLTLGCMELSIVLNALFFGIVIMQFITYWSEQKDKWPVRYLVGYTFLMDIAHSMIVTELLWKYTINGFGNPMVFLSIQWEYAITPAFLVLTVIPIQLFFAWRVKIITKSRMVGLCFFAGIVVMALAHGIVAIYLSAYALSGSSGIQTIGGMEAYVKVAVSWAAVSFATDMAVMFALIYMLYSRRTGFKASDSIIMRIIHVTVQSGIPIALFGIGHVISISVGATTGVVYLFSIPVGRVYTNTLLNNLNSRQRIRSGNSTCTSDEVNIVDTAVINHIDRPNRFQAVKINVSQSQSIQLDSMNRQAQSEEKMDDAFSKSNLP